MRMLTLNVAAFPYPQRCAGGMLPDPIERCQSIATKILEESPDIVTLQEVWSKSAYNVLSDTLRRKYPYITPFSGRCCYSLLLGSGLVIFSKNSTTDEYTEAFVDYRGYEIFAKKGFLSTRVESVGTVITTHLQAGAYWFDRLFCKDKIDTQEIARRQLRQIMAYIQTLPINELVYLTGDFNVEYLSKEYMQFVPILEKYGFRQSRHDPPYVTTQQHSIGIIDYCFTRGFNAVTSTTELYTNTLTDHKGLYIFSNTSYI